MNSTTHPVAPEEIMALLDGELNADERQAVSAHLERCAECAAVREEFLRTSKALAQWEVPEPSPLLDRAIEARFVEQPQSRRAGKPHINTPMSFRNWRLWVVGGGGAVAGALLLVASVAVYVGRPVSSARHLEYVAPQAVTAVDTFNLDGGAAQDSRAQAGIAGAEGAPVSNRNMAALVQMPQGIAGGSVRSPSFPPPGQTPAAPMIARTVSLTIRVKDIAASRAALDNILAQYHGYAATLTLNTPQDGPRSFQSSLRIPAPELQAGLEALRRLGKMQTESQSGEEVTQQHADLVARLTNARETELRLRQLLAERTGKMQDVLDVEEKISETRGEIESMEAEQSLLEHRVAFATVDVQLVEEFKEQLAAGASVSAGTRLHNAFIAGLRNAGGSILGLILFLVEYGPVLLIWLVILGGPAVWVWRRYRRIGRQL